MSKSQSSRWLRPETLTAVGIAAVAAAFLIPTIALKPISALLPAAMLAGMILLSLLLLTADQRAASSGEDAKPMTKSPKRVAGAFLLIFCYALATDLVGFYVSTAIAVPLIAYLFGYRSIAGLVVATVIVVGAIYMIFDFGMAQEFPTGRLWEG